MYLPLTKTSELQAVRPPGTDGRRLDGGDGGDGSTDGTRLTALVRHESPLRIADAVVAAVGWRPLAFRRTDGEGKGGHTLELLLVFVGRRGGGGGRRRRGGGGRRHVGVGSNAGVGVRRLRLPGRLVILLTDELVRRLAASDSTPNGKADAGRESRYRPRWVGRTGDAEWGGARCVWTTDVSYTCEAVCPWHRRASGRRGVRRW